mmetsp:Transcript_87439/g.248347  ORF Transcript_87439/g.248347 Transcript_87439/m.248347 type:complete len:532 (-) Transcript_87439:20-1615(-)
MVDQRIFLLEHFAPLFIRLVLTLTNIHDGEDGEDKDDQKNRIRGCLARVEAEHPEHEHGNFRHRTEQPDACYISVSHDVTHISGHTHDERLHLNLGARLLRVVKELAHEEHLQPFARGSADLPEALAIVEVVFQPKRHHPGDTQPPQCVDLRVLLHALNFGVFPLLVGLAVGCDTPIPRHDVCFVVVHVQLVSLTHLSLVEGSIAVGHYEEVESLMTGGRVEDLDKVVRDHKREDRVTIVVECHQQRLDSTLAHDGALEVHHDILVHKIQDRNLACRLYIPISKLVSILFGGKSRRVDDFDGRRSEVFAHDRASDRPGDNLERKLKGSIECRRVEDIEVDALVVLAILEHHLCRRDRTVVFPRRGAHLNSLVLQRDAPFVRPKPHKPNLGLTVRVLHQHRVSVLRVSSYSTASLLHNRLAGFRHDEACGFPLYSWQRVVAGGLRFHSFARLVRIGAPWRHLVGHGQNRFRCQLQKASPKPPSLIGTAETSTFYESTRDEALSGICSPMPSTTLAPVAQQQRELLSVNEAIP